MATITPTIVDIGPNTRVVTWTPIANADTAASVEIAGWKRASAQTLGTFGGTSVGLQSSGDDTNFAVQGNIAGTAIAHTVASISDLWLNARTIKPVLTGGAASSITHILVLRK
jgi:hypothetical protein